MPFSHFFTSFPADSVILTPNRRLSATLHLHYHQHQIAEEKSAWPTPAILPLTTWLTQLWHDHARKSSTSPLLLNDAQEQFIWEKIIAESSEHNYLLQVSETAELARTAFALLQQWEVDIHHPLFASSEDYQALSRWVKVYQQQCKENKWLDTATLPIHLINNLHSLTLPKNIITYGFTEYSPQLKRVFSACETIGSSVEILYPETITHSSSRIGLLDSEMEIETLARFARAIHEQEPGANIGCVIPTLDKMRDRVVQVFSQVFATDNFYAIDQANVPYNISAGKKLSQTPIIHTALLLLSLNKKTLPLEKCSHLLTTPFIGEAELERIQRAKYESQLRFDNKSMLTLKTIIASQTCPQLGKRLLKVISQLEMSETYLRHSEWANQFCQLLSHMGWPGERSLNSEEYQIVESWLNLLTEFATLDVISQPVTYNQALHRLKKMAANKVFQAKSPQTSIQVLGLLEAAGIPFDYLWIAGMDDISWPPQPKPNPFIPKKLQRDLQMPHATAERELTFCTLLMQQFTQCSKNIIYSHAEKQDELELQPSPLIRDDKEITLHNLPLTTWLSPAKKIFFSRQLEVISDDNAPAITADEKIRGGVSVLKHQALCPFKSFAEWRLHARAMESPLPGLRAKDRGNVIHKSLELIWNQLLNQANLLAMDDDALHTLIEESIQSALTSVSHAHHEYKIYISLEKKRLQRLLHEWINFEKSRPPFSLMTNEKSLQYSLGALVLNMRVDRIDQLEDGTKFIIDYKTGKNNDVGTWFGERPEEPQLPLYALMDDANTSGITFAQVHTEEHCFKGISHYAMDMKGVRVFSDIKKTSAISWQEQLQQWKDILTKLGTDFYYGIAKVDPKDPKQTCNYCSLKPFCRIQDVQA